MHAATINLHKSPGSGWRLLNAGAHEAPKDRDFPLHQHSAWELVYYRAGHIDFLLGDEIVPVEPGVLLFAPPHIPHAERARTAYANFHLLISVPSNIHWPRLCYDDVNQSFHRLCGQIVNEFQSNNVKHAEMVSLLIAQLDIAIERSIRDVRITSQERLVRKAEVLMSKDFAQPLRISQIAERSGASVSSLRSLFLQQRGCSPIRYLQQTRLRHAFRLLMTSDLTLEAIAAMSGYHSASHLSRHIKGRYGTSPGTLRKGRGV